jgi:transcription elongation factor GreA
LGIGIEQNKISISSPIARALIGKSVGDTLTIPIPKGKIEVEILEVEFIV